MEGNAAWEPPSIRPKRKNAVIRIYDAPLYRDWAAWLTVCMSLLAGFSIPFGKPPSGLSVWLNTTLAVLTFGIFFGVFPAILRLRVRRIIWHRRNRAQGESARNSAQDSALHQGLPVESSATHATRSTSVSTHPDSEFSDAAVRATPTAISDPMVSVEDISLSTALKVARSEFQYPVARAARALQVTKSFKDRYDAMIDTSESLLVTLGIVAISWMRTQQVGSVEIAEFREALTGRGVAQGHWYRLIQALARYDKGSDQSLPGATEAFRRAKKGMSLFSALESLINERNRSAHGGRPRNEIDAKLRMSSFFPALELAIDRSGFLIECPWFLVRSSSYRRADSNFVVTADRVMGDHPDFETCRFESAAPLADDNFYMKISNGLIDLSPFLASRYCDECHEAEVFYADRLDRVKGVSLKSFGRGHAIFDASLRGEIEALG